MWKSSVHGMTLNTISRKRIEELKQRTADHFCPEGWQTDKMFNNAGFELVGAAISSNKISATFDEAPGEIFRHLRTFKGNPASYTSETSPLTITQSGNTVQNGANMGDHLYED